MKTVCFFGGSFNPPHTGHLGVARGALRSGKCSKVIWVPAWKPPHKQDQEQVSFHHRLAMVRQMIAGEENMLASDLEEQLKLDPSYTFHVMQHFSRMLDTGEVPAILIGADSLLELHKWFRAADLIRDFEILTYPRSGCSVSREKLLEFWDEKTAEKLLSGILDGIFFEISSTVIRKSMAFSGNVEHINNRETSAYCREHGLYTKQKKEKA